jgi:hypothetical protein
MKIDIRQTEGVSDMIIESPNRITISTAQLEASLYLSCSWTWKTAFFTEAF